jgi:tRNA dimethylallyltransferase
MNSAAETAIVIVAGPTGSGKSALALALAEEFAGTIINADSQQAYRDLAVLTARPGPEELARAPHRLYGVIDAGESCSAGRWGELALAEIAAARQAGRLPILVGGTGLYLEALLQGLAEVPAIPGAVREEARALYARLGGAEFRAHLLAIDPTAARLAPSDGQRLTRAWEVVTATGRPLSEWQRCQAPPPSLPAAAVVLLPPRAALYAACDARFRGMMAGGAEAELRALLARDLPPSLPAMKAVGVPQLAAWLAGELSREDAVIAAQHATRRYVKRQYTWFRNRLPENERFRKLVVEAQFSESLLPEIFSFIRQFMLTVKT